MLEQHRKQSTGLDEVVQVLESQARARAALANAAEVPAQLLQVLRSKRGIALAARAPHRLHSGVLVVITHLQAYAPALCCASLGR